MPLPLHSTDTSTHPFNRIKYVIAIAAGKGGVGKSAITVNLALALRKWGCQVGVMDTDLYGPSIRKMLPEDRTPTQKGQKIIPAQCAGIKMISMAYFCKENEGVAVRAPIANGLISRFIHQVEWGDLDFLLIDFPPGTGDIQLTLSQQAQLTGAIMVTTPQEVALIDVRKAIHLFNQVKVPIIGIIENMSYFFHRPTGEKIEIFGSGGGKKLSEEVNAPLLGSIPLDPELCSTADQGQQLSQCRRAEDTWQAFMETAEKLVVTLSQSGKSPLPTVSQLDPYHFSLETGSQRLTFRYSDVQKNCSCAKCIDEFTGRKLLDTNSVKNDVTATAIQMVGRYGLRFQFNSGCSTGIYSFDHLIKIRESS